MTDNDPLFHPQTFPKSVNSTGSHWLLDAIMVSEEVKLSIKFSDCHFF